MGSVAAECQYEVSKSCSVIGMTAHVNRPIGSTVIHDGYQGCVAPVSMIFHNFVVASLSDEDKMLTCIAKSAHNMCALGNYRSVMWFWLLK